MSPHSGNNGSAGPPQSGNSTRTLPSHHVTNSGGGGGGGGNAQHLNKNASLKLSRFDGGDVNPISSAIVKYNYQAQQLDELSLVKGSRVMILEKSGDGWWRGQLGHKIGWFPSNYTQEELEDAHTYCMAENVLDIMVALYSFKAQNDTELSFDKGDRLEIIDRPASDPDWLKARNTQAQVGLVPKNYLVELSQYLTSQVENNHQAGSSGGAQQQQTLEALQGRPWFYGMISRAQCDDILAERGIDGDFLIRESETNVSKMSHVNKQRTNVLPPPVVLSPEISPCRSKRPAATSTSASTWRPRSSASASASSPACSTWSSTTSGRPSTPVKRGRSSSSFGLCLSNSLISPCRRHHVFLTFIKSGTSRLLYKIHKAACTISCCSLDVIETIKIPTLCNVQVLYRCLGGHDPSTKCLIFSR